MLTQLPQQFSFSSEAIFSPDVDDMEVDPSLKIRMDEKVDDAKARADQKKMKGIPAPHENDVLMGRGGKNNLHSGNEKLREIARERCEDYRFASKKGKSDLSRELVRLMRGLKPPTRFLKKDTKSNRWDDVGDDIAREKASQVLRDAVSEKNGPMARSKKKIGPSHDVFRPIHIAVNQRPATDDRIQGEYSHYDRFQIPSFHPATVRDMPPSSTVLNHPYVYSAASYRPPSVSMTPRHPSVTPAIASDSRKRPRLQESPSTAYSYNRFSPHNTSVGMNTPTEMILSTPVARDQLMPSSRHGYFSHGSSQGAYSPASAMIPEHYASGSRNEPWMADIHLHDPTQRAPVAAASDFDPYNEDILSDHSDHRDGAISPIIYPKQEDSI